MALLICATGFSQTSTFNHSQAPKETKQTLDSVINSLQKHIFTYDSKGNVVRYVMYLKNFFWIPDMRYDYDYNNLGKQTLQIQSEWDLEKNDWINLTKNVYSYNNQGNKTGQVGYEWDTDMNNWKKFSKDEFEMDENGRDTISAQYYWDDEINGWKKFQKNIRTFDKNGNETLWIVERYGEGNVWVPVNKKECKFDEAGNKKYDYNYEYIDNDWVMTGKTDMEYDAQGNKTVEEVLYWDFENNDWGCGNKTVSDYNTLGNKTVSVSYNWDTDIKDWIENYKTKYEYDTQGNITLETSFFWDSDINDWVKSFKNEIEYTYNNSQISKITTIGYFGEDNDWMESYKNVEEYTYNAGKVTMYIVVGYNWEDNQWVVGWKNKDEYSFDTHGNKTMYASYYWDSESNNWKGNNKNEYDFDLSYAASVLIFPEYINIKDYIALTEMLNMLLEKRHYEWVDGAWRMNETENYYWSAKEINGITDITKSSTLINVYPNPTTGILNIEIGNSHTLPEVKIYSIQGVLLIHTKGNTIDLSPLANGIYIANINGQSRKIVKN